MMIVLAGVLVRGVPPAAAADLKALGWWARTATANPAAESPTPLPAAVPPVPVTVPSGTGVGPGQLLVEGVPAGGTAVAALRWTLSASESSPSLVLPVLTGSTVTVDSVILACKAATEWVPPPSRPGTWESKPITDGRSCINGVVAADGTSVGFGLQPLLRRTTLDIVLVSGIDTRLPEGANGSSFRFMFDDPSADSLKVIKKTTSSASSGSGGLSTAPLAGIVETPPLVSPSLGDLRAGDTSVAAAPALPPQDLGPSVPRLESPVLAVDADDPEARTLAVVLLLVGAALAAWLAQSPPQRAHGAVAVGLGPFRRVVDSNAPTPVPEVRGLAGFARPRTRPPVPL